MRRPGFDPVEKFICRSFPPMANKWLSSWLKNNVKGERRKQNRLRVQHLEPREAPAIFTVTWDGNPLGLPEPNGAMTLQQAIAASNALGGSNQINYGKNFSTGTAITDSFVFSTAT